MSVKKIMLLATAAMAVAAFAIPATASAVKVHHFTYETKAITGEKDAELTGTLTFGGFLGGYSCQTHSKLKVNTADIKITNYEITTNECSGTGAFENCELKNHTTTIDGKPLSSENPITGTIDANTNLTLHGHITIHSEFKGAACQVEELTLTIPHVVKETEKDAQGYIEGFKLDPETEATIHVSGLEVPTETTGTTALTPKGKFSISTVDT